VGRGNRVGARGAVHGLHQGGPARRHDAGGREGHLARTRRQRAAGARVRAGGGILGVAPAASRSCPVPTPIRSGPASFSPVTSGRSEPGSSGPASPRRPTSSRPPVWFPWSAKNFPWRPCRRRRRPNRTTPRPGRCSPTRGGCAPRLKSCPTPGNSTQPANVRSHCCRTRTRVQRCADCWSREPHGGSATGTTSPSPPCRSTNAPRSPSRSGSGTGRECS
jgi:hypothetical protein